ncbi:MAG: hypothetical protein R2827_05525 [Bdellovibrionales bacterium]
MGLFRLQPQPFGLAHLRLVSVSPAIMAFESNPRFALSPSTPINKSKTKDERKQKDTKSLEIEGRAVTGAYEQYVTKPEGTLVFKI